MVTKHENTPPQIKKGREGEGTNYAVLHKLVCYIIYNLYMIHARILYIYMWVD